ncbi:hypothetical protein GQ53DRAFT_755337 [Thozetella sp. PMI_491]|nr:hypothetical protein GQ53DRAFT_755337 [Thozetella sp. PMI_491]
MDMLFRRHGDEMDMDMTMPVAATPAIAAAEASTTAMAGMDMGSTTDGSSSTMMTMMAVFNLNTDTPLYSIKWMPASIGAYAATCIFLIILAVLFRTLLAVKAWQEARWVDRELNRRYIVVNGKQTLADNLSRDSLAKQMTLSENGVEENVIVVKKQHQHWRPFRLSVDPIRAVLDTVLAGVGYLMMLAVMTMNLGYFLSILGGTFLGSLLVGRFNTHSEH